MQVSVVVLVGTSVRSPGTLFTFDHQKCICTGSTSPEIVSFGQTTLHAFTAVLPFSKLNNVIFGYFDPENIFLDNENKQLTDNSAKKEALIHWCRCTPALHYIIAESEWLLQSTRFSWCDTRGLLNFGSADAEETKWRQHAIRVPHPEYCSATLVS